jgi:hypothetical protein
MHPVIIEQVAADHIRDIHTEAAAERRARQARQARRDTTEDHPGSSR